MDKTYNNKGFPSYRKQMPDVWLDSSTPKVSIIIHSLLPLLQAKGYTTLVTAKNATQTTDMLDVLKVPYHKIGGYGETLKEKLAVESKRNLAFIDLFDQVGYPKVLWTHGDVSAIRTAFGLNIPIVYANDTVFAYHVARLAVPLVDWLIAPVSFGKSWSKFGIPKSRIIHYDGLEEVAWLKDAKFEQPKFLQKLSKKKPIILFRDAEYKRQLLQKRQNRFTTTRERTSQTCHSGLPTTIRRGKRETRSYR